MQEELTLHLSSSWMYIAYTSFLFVLTKRGRIFLFCAPLLMIWQKRGEKFGVLYMHVYVISYMHVYVIYMHVYFSISISAYIFCLCIHWISLYVYCYAWVKGELLWSLTLIHAYITPWVLSLSKRGRLLAQRPITLVLMMINSCSYCLLIILCLNSFSDWPRY